MPSICKIDKMPLSISAKLKNPFPLISNYLKISFLLFLCSSLLEVGNYSLICIKIYFNFSISIFYFLLLPLLLLLICLLLDLLSFSY